MNISLIPICLATAGTLFMSAGRSSADGKMYAEKVWSA
jgi:hypothetical protein